MKFLIFLLLYCFSMTEKQVFGCLSNQGGCSVASYRYNSECRKNFVSSSMHQNSYNHDSYSGFLGSNVQARAYSERKTNSDFAKFDTELHCLSTLNCTWQNTIEDSLDWVLGEGNVDPTKLSLITGSYFLPGNFDRSFLILASNPRPSQQDGQLLSLAIGCQQTTGILSFRYWRSRARTAGKEPLLDICTKKLLDSTLENCMTVTPTLNHTIIASIPPIYEPFILVLRGYNFENEPEGGLIIIDEIEYFAEFDEPENCAPKNIDESLLEPFNAENRVPEAKHVISGDTEDHTEKNVLISRDVQAQAAPSFGSSEPSELIVLNETSQRDCQAMQCLVEDTESLCDYKRSGTGSKGEGYLVGWRITSAEKNVANKLTGVHVSPGSDNKTNFLVANFAGFRRDKTDDRFVLEAPEFTINDDSTTAYLSFRKFLSTKGLYLSICEDGYGQRCFWNVYENSAEPFARKWTHEVVLLPGDLTTFYIIGWQNTSMTTSYGQIGLTEIALYTDLQATHLLC